MVQVIKHLRSKNEALSSNPNGAKKKKEDIMRKAKDSKAEQWRDPVPSKFG
jgi:FtsZ-binding cell division protein ZapB